jgi:hypothetical protein
VNEFLIVTQSDQRLVKLLIDADELPFFSDAPFLLAFVQNSETALISASLAR